MTTRFDYGYDHEPFERAVKQQVGRARSAFWIITVARGTGQLCVLGPYPDEESASSDLFSKLGGDGEVKELGTIDRSRATSMAKKMLLDQTANLDLSIRRASHQPPKEGEKGTSRVKYTHQRQR